MPDTLSKTTAELFQKDTHVNLERSIILGDRIDGHFVQGHVDTRAHAVQTRFRNGKHTLTIRLPRRLMKFVALHGSISINGVALTVSSREHDSCSVSLIPYTIKHTNLGTIKSGEMVNVEIDMIARYLAVLLKK